MRFFEFSKTDAGLDKFVMILRNFIGRASSKGASANLNWASLQKIATDNGFEFAADYETFKSIYDTSPAIQSMVKNFNDKGIELNVPGAKDEEPKGDGTQTPQDSQAAVDKIAASAAPQQLAQA